MIKFFWILKIVNLKVFLQGTRDKIMSVEKLKNQKGFFHGFDQFVLVLVFVELGLKDNVVWCAVELFFHPSDSSVQFEIVYETLLNLSDLFGSIFKGEAIFHIV